MNIVNELLFVSLDGFDGFPRKPSIVNGGQQLPELTMQFAEACDRISSDRIIVPFAFDQVGKYVQLAKGNRCQLPDDGHLLFYRSPPGPCAGSMFFVGYGNLTIERDNYTIVRIAPLVVEQANRARPRRTVPIFQKCPKQFRLLRCRKRVQDAPQPFRLRISIFRIPRGSGVHPTSCAMKSSNVRLLKSRTYPELMSRTRSTTCISDGPIRGSVSGVDAIDWRLSAELANERNHTSCPPNTAQPKYLAWIRQRRLAQL
jgi:hypothetical protein